MKYRAGGKGRTVGKDTETTRKVTTPKRQDIHASSKNTRGETRTSLSTEIPGRADFLMFIWVKENYPNPGRPR